VLPRSQSTTAAVRQYEMNENMTLPTMITWAVRRSWSLGVCVDPVGLAINLPWTLGPP
jgi:hypothetical protein